MKDKILKAVNDAADQVDGTVSMPILEHFLDGILTEYRRQTETSSALLERASMLVGNPGTNISASTDIACDNWHKEYERWKSQ